MNMKLVNLDLLSRFKEKYDESIAEKMEQLITYQNIFNEFEKTQQVINTRKVFGMYDKPNRSIIGAIGVNNGEFASWFKDGSKLDGIESVINYCDNGVFSNEGRKLSGKVNKNSLYVGIISKYSLQSEFSVDQFGQLGEVVSDQYGELKDGYYSHAVYIHENGTMIVKNVKINNSLLDESAENSIPKTYSIEEFDKIYVYNKVLTQEQIDEELLKDIYIPGTNAPVPKADGIANDAFGIYANLNNDFAIIPNSTYEIYSNGSFTSNYVDIDSNIDGNTIQKVNGKIRVKNIVAPYMLRVTFS